MLGFGLAKVTPSHTRGWVCVLPGSLEGDLLAIMPPKSVP